MSSQIDASLVRNWHDLVHLLVGRARQLCPGISDLDFLCDLKRIVHLDAELAHRAFNLRVAKQDLNGTQISSPAVYQRGLGVTERMCSK